MEHFKIIFSGIIVIIIFSFAADRLHAQTERNYFYLMGQAGAVSYHGDLTSVNDHQPMFDLGFSGGVGYVISPSFSLRMDYRRGEYPRTDRPNAHGYFRRHNVALYASYQFLPDATIRPYVLGGAGVTFFGTYDKGIQELDGSTYFGPVLAPAVGAGLDFVLSGRFSLFLEGKFDIVLDDEAMDEISGDRGFDAMGYISGGFRFNLRSTFHPVRGLRLTGPAEAFEMEELEYSASLMERATEPVTYEWGFGDGTITTGKTVTHRYQKPGEYTITVTAMNPRSSEERTWNVTVKERPVPVRITFIEADDTEPEVQQTVNFSAEIEGTEPVSVEWDFGDGTKAAELSAQHAYPEAGEFNATLTVENVEVAGEDGVHSRSIKITVSEPEPELPALAVVHFDLNSSFFDAEGREILMENVRILEEHPDLCVEVIGLTDATGPEDFNQWLSDRRAKRVKDFYIKNGIAAERIHAKGRGIATEPCPDSGPKCRENRRTESVAVECR